MIDRALDHLRAGEVIGLPTDTVYGIGADPHQPRAVARLFEIKGRGPDQPIGLLVSDLETALGLVELPDYARLWASLHWPGALNLVAQPKTSWPPGIGDGESLAVRVPDHPVALELLRAAGPLAVTSANRSGDAEALNDVEAACIFGVDVGFYLMGESPSGVASTSVDVRSAEPIVLRQGPLDLGI
ncbi:MAG TPA: L-threonylcarbamoyladenylate synthase [Acidimicrobiia bacterium]|nr:L-threonylcarbamoyladenylate synthase [Acidimicrobiia bacterium]